MISTRNGSRCRDQRVQQAGLLAVIAHEELAHAKAFRRDAADADQKRARAGAAGEAGGLGVEKRPLGGRRFGHRPAEIASSRSARQIRERADIGAAVPAMTLVQLFGFEVAAERGLDFLTGQPLFDVMMRRPRQRGDTGSGVMDRRGIFAIDSRDALRSSASCC